MGVLDVGPTDLSVPTWVFPASDPSVAGPIQWVLDASPVATRKLVLAVSRRDGPANPARLWAIDRETGLLAWSRELPESVLDSWASPTIDPGNGTALYATGRPGSDAAVVQARRLSDGSLVWETELAKDVVNASVVVTTDLGVRDRAFVVDYEGFYAGGDGALVYCINVDPRVERGDPDGVPADNPHVPGEIVWTYPLQAGAVGATPAYDGGGVYVATAGDFDFAVGGSVLALDATAGTASEALVWQSDLAGDDAFFGGVSLTPDAVLAATYNFIGGLDSARLVKLDRATGDLLWTTPANRTNSMPVAFRSIAGERQILLATGLPAFGSLPALQRFDDLGSAGVLREDSTTATWQDDGDGIIELGEFAILGGWTHQPHVVDRHPATGGPTAFVGSIGVPSGGPSPVGYTRISLIDLSRSFGDAGSVITAFDGAGSSPAIVQRSLYTIGPAGVHAFGLPFLLDVNGDGSIDIEDLYDWHADVGDRDVDRDGVVNNADRRALEAELRRDELRQRSRVMP